MGHGEVVGVIGRNGAGKSTLLKILARITEPTSGSAQIRGRVGSLLEVGTGFHQELTGRENIYLNGAILGMRRREIDSKFDEIVAFAGVEKFVDTPVKHYSSGMYLRLAFSVAAHLDPEILLVDEVLAVGDAAFQRKCLEKMEDVGRRGRTVLFVSHNMSAIARLCPRTILLDSGGVALDGPSHQVVARYLSSDVGTMAQREWRDASRAPASGAARLRAVRVRGPENQVTDSIDIRKPVGIEMEFDVLEPGWTFAASYDFYNEEGLLLFGSIETDPEWRDKPRMPGRYATTAWVPGNLLSEGTVDRERRARDDASPDPALPGAAGRRFPRRRQHGRRLGPGRLGRRVERSGAPDARLGHAVRGARSRATDDRVLEKRDVR